ncbi:MAG: hypothetical protein Q7S35_03165 [Candidatus Limnocylindrales bacterium]|nr:hypothetical protein [Candidatus Limnocylindrales bacterium]
MVPRTAATGTTHPDAVEFVRFCYHRRRVGWPELYDEMCAVAGRGLFRGLSADDLGGIGVGFSLFDMPALAGLASRVVAEEAALRRPVSLVITGPAAAPPDAPLSADRPGSSPASTAASTPASAAPTPTPARSAATASDERSFDVPIRLALAHSRP